jgi:uncharacterized protein YndB with AHSA1/START domain
VQAHEEADVIRRQVVMPVSPERLWHALTDPDEMAGWFGSRVEWELREGAPALFQDDDGTRRIGRVEVVRPARHLRYRWWPERPDQLKRPGQPGRPGQPDRPEPPGDRDSGQPGVSEVSYLLEPLDDGSGTRLTIQERQISASSIASAEASAAGRGGPAGPGSVWSAWDTRLAVTWSGLAARATEVVGA